MGKLPPKSLVRIWKTSVCFKETLQDFPNYFVFKTLVHLLVRMKCPEIPLRNNGIMFLNLTPVLDLIFFLK